MNDLTQSYLFKERLLKCEPIDLSRFVADSGRGTWIVGHLILICNHESAKANALILLVSNHQWCALPTKRALVTHSPYTLPRYMHLDLLVSRYYLSS